MIYSYAPWSYSKLKTAKTCPRRFLWLQDKSKVRVYPEQRPEARVGTAAHSVLELCIRDKVGVGYAIQEVITSQELTSIEVERLGSFRDDFEHFLERLEKFCELHKVVKVETELPLAIDKDFKPTDPDGDNIFFRGFIDLVLTTAGGRCIVLDHKSANHVRVDIDQLNSYTILVQCNRPEVISVQGALHYIPLRNIVWPGKMAPREDITNALVPYFVKGMEKAVDGLATEEYRVGKHCDYCEFKDECRSTRKSGSRARQPQILSV